MALNPPVTTTWTGCARAVSIPSVRRTARVTRRAETRRSNPGSEARNRLHKVAADLARTVVVPFIGDGDPAAVEPVMVSIGL